MLCPPSDTDHLAGSDADYAVGHRHGALTLSLQGSTITGSINGVVLGSGTDTTFTSGGIGFSTAANSELDNVSVVDGTGQGGGSPPPAPTLTSFTPTSGAVGATVTLSGSGFTGASSVAINGTLASSFTVVSATQLTAVVPAGATSGHLSVTTPRRQRHVEWQLHRHQRSTAAAA